MDQWYLVGEPLFKAFPSIFREEYFAPASQINLCRKVLRETQDAYLVLDRLRNEYLAIITALKEMRIDFRIVFCHEKEIDRDLIGICVMLGCRLVAFPKE